VVNVTQLSKGKEALDVKGTTDVRVRDSACKSDLLAKLRRRDVSKRTSALKYTRKMEAQLARLNKKAEASGVATNLPCIVGMFRDYIATLDETIKSAHTPRSRKNDRLSA
jgi:hypothetical protein